VSTFIEFNTDKGPITVALSEIVLIQRCSHTDFNTKITLKNGKEIEVYGSYQKIMKSIREGLKYRPAEQQEGKP